MNLETSFDLLGGHLHFLHCIEALNRAANEPKCAEHMTCHEICNSLQCVAFMHSGVIQNKWQRL